MAMVRLCCAKDYKIKLEGTEYIRNYRTAFVAYVGHLYTRIKNT